MVCLCTRPNSVELHHEPLEQRQNCSSPLPVESHQPTRDRLCRSALMPLEFRNRTTSLSNWRIAGRKRRGSLVYSPIASNAPSRSTQFGHAPQGKSADAWHEKVFAMGASTESASSHTSRFDMFLNGISILT